VVVTGEVEGPLHLLPVDGRDRDRGAAEGIWSLVGRRVELLDDREQVSEQLFALYRGFWLRRNDCASEWSSL
jgi:hypothetical protein